jgi:hypothetical protein
MLANAATINVGFNKPVTLNGAFPVYTYPGGPLCGTDPPQPSASIVDDGMFFLEQTCYQSGVYWHTASNSIDIDLLGVFQIDSAIVQADDNDIYTLQYRDISGVYHDWWNIGPLGTFGLITRPNSANQSQQQGLTPVVATGLRFLAPPGSGDGEYAVSEIQVFGSPVPEPATHSLAVLACFIAAVRKAASVCKDKEARSWSLPK